MNYSGLEGIRGTQASLSDSVSLYVTLTFGLFVGQGGEKDVKALPRFSRLRMRAVGKASH